MEYVSIGAANSPETLRGSVTRGSATRMQVWCWRIACGRGVGVVAMQADGCSGRAGSLVR